MARKIRVLIVEDCDEDAALELRELEKHGFEPEHERVWTSEGLAAALAKGGWDLILSDYRMLGFSGMDALRMASASLPAAPFILISGTMGEDLAVESLKAGAADYILKDRPARLGPAVERALKAAAEKEALRESEERFKMVFSNAAIGICLFAPDGRILDANDSLCRLLGCARPELLEKSFPDITAQAGVEDCRRCMTRMLAGEVSSDGPCERLLGRGKAEVHAEVTCALLRSSTGRPLYFIAEVRNLTIEKRAAAEKALLERQLAQAQKLEAIGRLAGGVAHDFNNLLTAISGFSGFLLESLPKGDPRREDVLEIRLAGERAAALTRQLLAFSRLRAVEPRVMDLNDAVREVLKMLSRVIGEDVEIETALLPGPAPVLADPNHIHQVLLNLAVNARDAMPTGGRLRIETRVVSLDEAAAKARPYARPGPYLALEVSDTGTGMDQAVLSHIFEAFFTTKAEGQGTGLGLSTIYGIVRQCGGFISVESAPGTGSKFTVHLPLVDREAPAKEPAPGASPPLARGEAVLVAEDDEFVRRFAVRALKSLGYRVFDAGSPEEALKLGVKEDVQLLLSDLVMPGMTGLELARRLGERKPLVKTLFMSGFSIESPIPDGAPPEDTLLKKPLSIESLAKAVRGALDPG
ncbi:MAG: response regulator [Elusimicrobia bacterium]|nr:response regulator [Elusimicrobiota bacterium]